MAAKAMVEFVMGQSNILLKMTVMDVMGMMKSRRGSRGEKTSIFTLFGCHVITRNG